MFCIEHLLHIVGRYELHYIKVHTLMEDRSFLRRTLRVIRSVCNQPREVTQVWPSVKWVQQNTKRNISVIKYPEMHTIIAHLFVFSHDQPTHAGSHLEILNPGFSWQGFSGVLLWRKDSEEEEASLHIFFFFFLLHSCGFLAACLCVFEAAHHLIRHAQRWHFDYKVKKLQLWFYCHSRLSA